MTPNQLKDIVLQLGFETTLESEDSFFSALARALYTVFIDRPQISFAELMIPKRSGNLISKGFVHEPTAPEEYSLIGAAVSFRISGIGGYIITCGGKSYERTFDSELCVCRERLNGPSTIRFVGEYSYTVSALAVFPSLTGPDEKDIPVFNEGFRIDLKTRIADFLAPYEAPKTENGDLIAGAEISSGILTLPDSFSGYLRLSYLRTPRIPTHEDRSSEIDMPEETRELLPLLVASYLWLDDDPEKAEYYRALYADGINTLRRNVFRRLDNVYKTNGWA